MKKNFTKYKLRQKQRFYSFKLREGKSLQLHVFESKSTVADLKKLYVKYEEEHLALLLLSSLSSQYKYFGDILLYGWDTIKLEGVWKVLLSKESHGDISGSTS